MHIFFYSGLKKECKCICISVTHVHILLCDKYTLIYIHIPVKVLVALNTRKIRNNRSTLMNAASTVPAEAFNVA